MNRHLFLACTLVFLVPAAACSSDSEGDGSGGNGGDAPGGAGAGGAGGGGEAGGGAGPDCTNCDEANFGQVCPIEDDCYEMKVCDADPDLEGYAWRLSFTHEDGDACPVEGATCSTTNVWGEHCDYNTTTASCADGAWQLEVEHFSCADGQGGGGAGG